MDKTIMIVFCVIITLYSFFLSWRVGKCEEVVLEFIKTLNNLGDALKNKSFDESGD